MFPETENGMPVACQRCNQPLRMDESFADLLPSAYDMIASLSDRSGSAFYQHPHNDPKSRAQPSPRPLMVPSQSNLRRIRGSPHSSHAQTLRVNNFARAQVPANSLAHAGGVLQTHQSSSPGSSLGPSESFVVLSESTVGAARAQPVLRDNPVPSSASQRSTQASTESSARQQKEQVVKLAELLSQNPSKIEHPLCTDCTDKLLELMHTELQAAKSNRDRYAVFERELNRERATAPGSSEGSHESCQKIREDIEKLKIKESEAIQKLKATESECDKIQAELKEIEKQEAELDKEEEQFWEDYNQYELDLIEVQSQSDSVLTRYRNDKIELEKLKATNVYKDAFCVGCEAGVGTINGLRLGKLADVPVEWVEINAAWGHTTLLLKTLCTRMDFTLDGFRLLPMGSFSRIERTKGDKACLELFGSDDLVFTRVLHNRRFDNAMVDFLECLRQVSDQATRRNIIPKIPFRIYKDKIGEASIKLSFSSDEAWTSALRHVLFTLKIINAALDQVPSG